MVIAKIIRKTTKKLLFVKHKKSPFVCIYEGKKPVGVLVWKYRDKVWRLEEPKNCFYIVCKTKKATK